jgi:hypothetical protein
MINTLLADPFSMAFAELTAARKTITHSTASQQNEMRLRMRVLSF